MDNDLVQDERITAIGLLSEAYAGLSARFGAQFAEHALAPVEFEVLLRLARSPQGQLRMTDLSTQTGSQTKKPSQPRRSAMAASSAAVRASPQGRTKPYLTLRTVPRS